MSAPLTVNIAVAGKFHLANYVGHLANHTPLRKFYFSHRVRTLESVGLSADVARNFPLKEYLIQAHGRTLKSKLYEQLIPVYHKMWANSVLREWTDSRIFHFVSQGACVELVQRAKLGGALVLCEAVNTHPINRNRILAHEREQWGLRPGSRPLLQRECMQMLEAELADALLVPSAIVGQSYKKFGIDVQQFRLPYASNISKFFPNGEHTYSSNRPLKIIAVGHIGLRKGQLYLLDALKHLGSSFELTLVGTVDPLILGLIGKHVDKFQLIPRMEHELMPGLLARHDIFVSASLEEGLAVSICEAMAMGLPVVATRESGAEELIVDNVNGLLVEARNSEALVQQLLRLSDETLRAYIGRNALAASRQVNNWEAYAQKLSIIYNQINDIKK